MARVSCTYTFSDGDSVGASVEFATSYPDAMHEAVKTCSDMFRDAVRIGLDAQAGDDED